MWFFVIPRLRTIRTVYIERTCRPASEPGPPDPSWTGWSLVATGLCVLAICSLFACVVHPAFALLAFASFVGTFIAAAKVKAPPAPVGWQPLSERMWHSDRR